MTWPPEPPADSDASGYDAWRDDIAVPCPYEPVWEPAYTHGLVLPPDIAADLDITAAMPPSPIQAGRSRSADAGEDPSASPARGPLDVNAPAMPGWGA